MQTGVYRGNENLSLNNKPIPPLLNVGHQEDFRDTLNAALRDVSAVYSKKIVNGKPWVVGTFEGVPPDIAKSLQKKYHWRSGEFLTLKDPDTGEVHKNVIRSTAFLHKSTRPAVGGQSPDIVVECAGPEDPLLTIITHQTPHTEEGENIMADNTKTVDVAELQRNQAASAERIAELEAEKAQRDAEKKEQEVKELALNNRIAELQAAQERTEIAAIEKEWMQPRVFGNRSFMLAPAAREVFMTRVAGNGVAELAEGETQRENYVNAMNQIIEMAGNGTLLVQTSLEGVAPNSKPGDNKPKTEEEKIAELQAKDSTLSYGDAWEIVEGERLGKEAA
jgi:hypothetical protein